MQTVCISHQILAFSAKFSRNSDKFSSKSGRKSFIFHSENEISFFILRNFVQIFWWNFEIEAVQKCDNLVELEKCCKMRIWTQKSASKQKRTSLPKFGGRFFSFVNLCLMMLPFYVASRTAGGLSDVASRGCHFVSWVVLYFFLFFSLSLRFHSSWTGGPPGTFSFLKTIRYSVRFGSVHFFHSPPYWICRYSGFRCAQN